MKKKLLLPFKFLYSIVSLLLLFYYKRRENSILFISHDMSISGAPIVLKTLIKKVKKDYKCTPVLLTLLPGELCYDYVKQGIFPISCQFFRDRIISMVVNMKFKKIFINTIVCYDWARVFEKNNIQYIWWIHEGMEYATLYIDKLPNNINNGKILFVSDYSRNVFSKMGFHIESEIMPYFLTTNTNAYNKKIYVDNQKTYKTILVIGSICPRKNQIEAIHAFKTLRKIIGNTVSLKIIGKSIDDTYYNEVINYASNDSGITFIDCVSNKDIWKVYQDADVLLCCSTDDPLPVTITEGLMYGCKVIVGSNCGQYDLIIDGVNGFKYTQGNIQELVKCLLFALNSNNDDILESQYHLYINNFTEEIFNKRVTSLLGLVKYNENINS